MKQSILNKWVRAARSGKYKKAIGALRVSDCGKNATYCFMGVLCDLHAKETGNTWSSDNRYMGHGGALPKEVQIWAGLNSCDPNISGRPNSYGTDSISDCNDDNKLSLRQMATLLIKAQRKGWLGKVINDVRKRKKITKKKEIVYGGRLGTGITGELEHEQPEESAQVRT